MIKVKNNVVSIDNSLEITACPLCQSDSISKQGDVKYHSPTCYSSNHIQLSCLPELWTCLNCNSGFIQHSVPESDSVFLYSTGDASLVWDCELSFDELKTSVAVNALSMYLEAGVSVLDVGCNTGELLDFARLKGCQTCGIEYSQKSRRILSEKGHGAYSHFDELEGPFDVITAFDLVEHLYDVPAFLESCLERLSPGGHLIFLTGDAHSSSAKLARENWWYIRFPEHVVFPSRQYFESCPRMELVDWIPTYVDSRYERSFLENLKGIVKQVIQKKYSGLYTFTPDQVLIILQKNL